MTSDRILERMVPALLALFLLSPCLPAQRMPRERQPLQFPVPAQQQQGKPAVLKIRVEEGRVIADISDCPMQKALQELADRTGIIFEVRSEHNPMVSVHLQRVSLEEAVQRLTSGSNVIFLYGQAEESDRITTVRIIPRTPAIPQPGLIYLGSGMITKTSHTVETLDQALTILSDGKASIEDREVGIEILVKARSQEAVKALVSCITDPAPEIRAAAIDGLAAMEERTALPAILKGLKDEHPGVRQSAAAAVALLGDTRNVKDLKPLSVDKDSSVAAAAEIAIRKLSAGEKR